MNLKSLSLFFILIITLVSCSSKMPTDIGVQKIKPSSGNEKMGLRACPDKPNCVVSEKHSTDDEDGSHFQEPIKIISNKARAYEKIKGILSKTKGAKIITESENYIHAEFTSSLFKFVDDVEFYFGDEGFVHFRSASRTGYSDRGVNKTRLDTIKFRYHQNDF